MTVAPATVRVWRADERWQHRAGRYRIVLDGEPTALISNGEVSRGGRHGSDGSNSSPLVICHFKVR
jgi:hypothetical protein